MILTLDRSDRLYEEMLANAAEHEQVDLGCGENEHAFLSVLREAVNSDGGEPHDTWKAIAPPSPKHDDDAPEPRATAAAIPHGGKVLKTIRGMGTVYDWRDSPWTQPSGGRIVPLLGVQHIPVIKNVDGFGDLITLELVLQAQRLQVQQGTDREGNVALFTPGDFLCWQAKGANQCSWGTEHMHLATGEAWTKRQLRAAAWVNQLNNRHYGTPLTRATLGAGSGVVRVVHSGQTTHEAVSNAAGFHDRSDPGSGYDFDYVAHCEVFFDKHGHFQGA